MTADEMDSEPLHNLAVPVVEAHPAGKRQADRIDDGVHRKGTPKTVMAHASSCTVGHFPILQVEQGFGEVRKVSRVIIVKMRDNNVGNGRCGNPELAKCFDRMDQHGPPAPLGLLRAKSGVNQDKAFPMADQPNKILDPALGVVGISCFQAEFANGPNRSAIMYCKDFPVGQIRAPFMAQGISRCRITSPRSNRSKASLISSSGPVLDSSLSTGSRPFRNRSI